MAAVVKALRLHEESTSRLSPSGQLRVPFSIVPPKNSELNSELFEYSESLNIEEYVVIKRERERERKLFDYLRIVLRILRTTHVG